MIPEMMETRGVYLSAFYDLVQADYSTLEVINHDFPDVNDYDPDDIRTDFSNAICEAADAIGLGCLTAEEEGELADWVLDGWSGLNNYFIATTDMHLNGGAMWPI